MFLGKVVGEVDPSKLIPLTLHVIRPEERRAMQEDLEKILDGNRGWGDEVDHEDGRSRDRERGPRDGSLMEERPGDLDRDRDRDHGGEIVMEWGGRKYTFAQAIEALTRSRLWPKYTLTRAGEKANELVTDWIEGDFRVRDQAQRNIFIQKVIDGSILLGEHVRSALFTRVLDGRLGVSPEVLQALASKLFASGVDRYPVLAHLVMTTLQKRFGGIPPGGPPAVTQFNEAEDLGLVGDTVVNQPIPARFVQDPANEEKVVGFEQGQGMENMASLVSGEECSIEWLVFLFIRHVFGIRNVAFIPESLRVALMRNYHLFSDKREVRGDSIEGLLKAYLSDPAIDVIVVPVLLHDEDGFVPYRILHQVLAGSSPSIPEFVPRDPAAHANMLVLDKTSRRFELFEPGFRGIRGKATPEKIRHLGAMKETFELVHQWAKVVGGFKMGEYVCYRTPGETGVQRDDSMCASWSVFYMMLRMVNPGVPERMLRPAMSYRTLGWFFMYLYVTMPNIFSECFFKVEEKTFGAGGMTVSEKAYVWHPDSTLKDLMGLPGPYPMHAAYVRGGAVMHTPYPRDVRVVYPRAVPVARLEGPRGK